MLATGSWDHTVRIWPLNRSIGKTKPRVKNQCIQRPQVRQFQPDRSQCLVPIPFVALLLVDSSKELANFTKYKPLLCPSDTAAWQAHYR